ncbi:MAG: alpha/beta hydrolase [Planctomycetota bacterium]
MWCETLLIFPTWQIPPGDWNPSGFSHEDVFFQAEDGTRLNGWYFASPDPRAHVLYCHGNGEHLAHMGDYMDELREKYQVSIFAFDYRGYGRSEGKPHEAGVIADARAARTWLAKKARIKPEEVVLWGRSIGGAVAVALAAEEGARGMILERTFTSLPDVAARHYPWLPVRLLMRNRFDSLSLISDYHGPLLQSHGIDDEIVPFSLGKALFDAAGSRDKQFVAMPNVTHNGPSSKEYHAQLNRFLKRL